MQIYTNTYKTRLSRLIYLLLIVAMQVSYSQTLKIFDFNTNNYPIVKSKLIYLDENHKQVKSDYNLFLSENAKQVDNLKISKKNSTAENYSLLISTDISESFNGSSNLILKSLLSELISTTDTIYGEVAIQCFNNFNYLLSGYSKDIPKLNLALNQIKPFGTTDFDNAFLNLDFPAKEIIKTAKHRKVILLINDGTAPISIEDVRKFLVNNNVTLFVATINTKTPQALKSLSEETNGYSFDYINSEETAKTIARIYNFLFSNQSADELEWTSNECELSKKIFCNIVGGGISDISNYEIKQNQLPFLSILPKNYDFGLVSAGGQKDQKFKLKAINKDFLLADYFDSNTFKLLNLDKNYLLKNGEEIEVTVRFQPLDTFYISSQIKFNANSCSENILYVSGGSSLSSPKTPTLKVVAPNGGEKFNAEGIAKVQWSGVLQTDTVSLEYSLDNGKNWTFLTNNVVGGMYFWKPLPNANSNECLVKVKQNATIKDFSKVMRLPKYNGEIACLNWLNDEKQIIVATKDGFVRLWDIEKLQVNRTLAENIRLIKKTAINESNQYLGIISDTSDLIAIYSAQVGGFLGNLYGNGERITDFSWNETGNIIAATTITGKIIIWEYPSANPQLIINAHSKELTSISFSKSGTLLSVGTVDGFAKIFELSGDLKHNLYNYDYRINNISWNSSGSVIAVSGNNENIKIWDLSSETNVLTINNRIKPTNFVSWQPDNSQLFSIQENNSIYLWNPANGNFNYDFPLHSGNVSCLNWSKSGNFIASGSKTGEVFIWSPKDVPFESKSRQEDVSNAVFSITPASIAVKGIDFGTVEVGENYEIEIRDLIKNMGLNPIRIDSLMLYGDTKVFFEIDYYSIKTLNNAEPFGLKAVFQAKEIGKYFDTLIVFLDYKIQFIPISANSISKTLTFEPTFLDFDSLNIAEISAIKKIKITNNTTQNIIVNKPIFELNSEYSSNQTSEFEVPANSSIEIDITFNPKSKGFKPELLKFSNQSNSKINQILLYGVATAPNLNINNKFDFQSIQCNDAKDTTLILKNLGDGKLFINDFKNYSNTFSLSPNLRNFEISAFDSIPITIIFETNIFNKYLDSITFTTNMNENLQTDWKINLLATRDTIIYELSENSLLFYDIDINTPAQRNINLRNNGTLPINIDFPIDFEYFTLEKQNAGPINVGDIAQLTVKFKGAGTNGLYHQNYEFENLCNISTTLKMVAYIGSNNSIFASLDSLNFADVICGFPLVDTIVKIQNSGSTPLLISDFELSDDVNFICDLPEKEIVLLPKEFIEFNIYYSPQNIQNHSATLKFKSNSGNAIDGINTIYLNGRKLKYDYEFSKDTLIFTDVLENIPTENSFKIKNNGNIGFWMNANGISRFKIIEQLPIFIPANSEKEIVIRLENGINGEVIEEELVFEDSCDDRNFIIIRANVTGFAPAGLSIGNYSAKPGEIIEIPIELYSPKGTPLPDVDAYLATLEINSTLLVPQFSNFIQRIEQKKRFIEVEIPKNGEWKVGNQVSLKFLATLGDTISTDLNLRNVRILNSNLKVESKNGKFNLDDVCIDDTVRLIDGENILRFLQNYPNPANENTNIAIELIEEGIHTLEIQNYLGQSIALIFSEFKSAGTYSFTADLSKLPIGIYYLNLITPTQSRTRKMLIER